MYKDSSSGEGSGCGRDRDRLGNCLELELEDAGYGVPNGGGLKVAKDDTCPLCSEWAMTNHYR